MLSTSNIKKRLDTKRKKEEKIKKLKEDKQYKEIKEVWGWLRRTKEFTLLEKWEWEWNMKDKYIWKRSYILNEAINHCEKGCPDVSYLNGRGLCSCYKDERGDILPKSSKVVSLMASRPKDEDF